MITYGMIHWDTTSGKFCTVADPQISLGNHRYVYVIVEGNSHTKEINLKTVKLTRDNSVRVATKIAQGKPRFFPFREDQVRQWHPEFGIEDLDELVNKATIFERLSI